MTTSVLICRRRRRGAAETVTRSDAIGVGTSPPPDNVIIEGQIGVEPIRYELDKAAGLLMVDRFLCTSMRYDRIRFRDDRTSPSSRSSTSSSTVSCRLISIGGFANTMR
jgi:hypothetical protein